MIVTHRGPRVLNRRRTKKFVQETRDQKYGSKHRNGKRHGGRKPRKPHKQNAKSKWATHVLSYINEEEEHFDSIIFDTQKYKLSDFGKIHALFLAGKTYMIKQTYSTCLQRRACEEEYTANILPNLTPEKFSNLNPAKMYTWIQIAANAMPATEDGRAERVQNALTNFTKDELVILQQLFKQYSKMKQWQETRYGKECAFGEKFVISLQEAQDFASLCDNNNLGYRLHFTNSCFENVGWRNRIDNHYYECNEVTWRSSKCSGCKKQFWNEEMTSFTVVSSEETDCENARYCSGCFWKIIQENQKKSKKACGEETGPTLSLSCGKKCGCIWNMAQVNSGREFVEKKAKLSKDEVVKIWGADYERLVVDAYRKLPAQILAKPDDLGKFEDLHYRLGKVNDVSCAVSSEIIQEVQKLRNQINQLFMMTRCKSKFPVLDQAVDDLVAKVKVSSSNESFTNECKALVNPIHDILQNRPDPTATDVVPPMFGISMYDVANMKLQRAKDALNTAYCVSVECSICFTACAPRETDILAFHDILDQPVADWKSHGIHDNRRSNFKLPCHTCKDCFGNYLNFKKALGKPALKCPGMNCGCHLKKANVKKLAPVAFADYEASLMRYSLKKVRNYRTCPNADCSAGLILDIDCNVSKITCSACNFSFCPHCNDTPHEGMSCEEMRRKRHKERWGETKDYMENETKQCPFCLAWIEKNGGCNHMTCHHCRGEFCWLCFGDWKSHRSCEDKQVVVRRPFNELFPDWKDKPAKVLLPRFSVGKYVTFSHSIGIAGIASNEVLGRVLRVEPYGMYVVEPVNGSFIGLKKVQESFMRGYNQPVATSISSEEAETLEESTYASFLAGFDDEATKTPAEPEYVSVELTTFDDDVDANQGSTQLTAKQLLEKFAPDFKTAKSAAQSLRARNAFKNLKTLKAQRQERATREKAREVCDDSDEESSFLSLFSDSEDESTIEAPLSFWVDSSDDDDESTVEAPSNFWLNSSDDEDSSCLLGDSPDPDHGAFSDDEDS